MWIFDSLETSSAIETWSVSEFSSSAFERIFFIFHAGVLKELRVASLILCGE
jgi:hypothetical protein